MKQGRITDDRREFKKTQSKRRLRALVILIYVLIVALLVVYPYYKSYIAPWRQTVLKVNDRNFDMRYFLNRLRLYASGLKTDTFVIALQLLEIIQNEELMRQEALKRQIKIPDEKVIQEIRNRVESSGIEGSDFTQRYQLMLQQLQFQEREFQELVKTDFLRENLKKQLRETLATRAEQVHVYAMLVETARKAGEIKAKLDAGHDFNALALKESLDFHSKKNGGDLGWLPKGVNETEAETQAHVLGILAKNREEAEQILIKIEGGEDFGMLAREMSLDKSSKEHDGDLGWINKGSYDKPLDGVIFKMETGVVSQPIQSKEGYWIIKVQGKTPEGKIIDDIAFGLSVDETTPPLYTKAGYYLLKVSEKSMDRPLEETHQQIFLDKAFQQWLMEMAQRGRQQGLIQWYWDSSRYSWVVDHLK
ncbi:MAG: peptidylprolyl isomerase [Candidatus Tectomicrobia bacterium]|uniref:Peptidylprolyl isomerase n=1 Tax=Tectimicrobiota bacterium TaxID=2528274 RepID=A0A933GM49_UNCTE|nr:peptidylprolyl isomerase [Candidatus Tectomicrobia bacterium]